MVKFYSLLANSGTPDQNGDGVNYINSIARGIPLALGIVVLFVNVFTSCIFEGFAFVYFIICTLLSIVACSKPSIFHTMPTNYKKRTLYYFVDIIISTLLTILIIAVAFAVIVTIAVIIENVNGLAAVDDTADTEEVVDITISAAASLFSLFRTLFFCGAVTGICRIENKKHYLITMIAFLLIYAAGCLTMTITVAWNSRFTVTLWFYQNFEKLPLPWLATTLCALFAVAAWVWAVLFVLKVEKPKAF
jgi:hypothetical protein